jgi:polysaccharide export outer membrane protein
MRFTLSSRVPLSLLCAALLAPVAVCLAQSNETQGSLTESQPSTKDDSPAKANSKHPVVDAAVYKIGVGDVLHITVFEEPQFTETAIVRPDGKISLPLISEISVSGLTPDSVETTLTTHLEKYVHKPRVTVTVQEIRSRMVYVTGEVQRPGAYPLVDSMNVVQLIARSGGPTDFARKNKVYVLRADKGARINIDYRKVLKGQAPQQNVDLAPGDTVVVP